MTHPQEFPASVPDESNQRLLANVGFAQWTNPQPRERYNLVVIGAGTAGLVAAAGAAGLGAKVALIERRLMGGDCLNFGCVPSKSLLAVTRELPGGEFIDFGSAIARMRRIRADLSANDSVARFTSLGVDVFGGAAQFTSPETLAVDGQTLRFHRAVIATGGRAAAPPVEGLEAAGYLTNETVFSLTALPRRIAIIGGGAIGCELAQAFRRFGAQVTILEAAASILPREDADAVAMLRAALIADGVAINEHAQIASVESRGSEKSINYVERGGASRELRVDEILVAAGRAPNLEGLGLETAGVAYDRSGVQVDDRLRTTNPRVYAAGDVCTPYQFTHMADAMARIVIRNALFLGRARVSALIVPRCIYTAPELAQTGLTMEEAAARALKFRSITQDFAAVDRAIIDGSSAGLLKLTLRENCDQIVGATIVAPHAGEMVSVMTLAIARKIGLRALGGLIYPYPTLSESVRKLSDAENRARLTPRVKRVFRWWFGSGGKG